MISMSELSDAWKEIIPQAGQSVGRRADKNHPLDFFITYDENRNMQMMLISEFLPTIPPSQSADICPRQLLGMTGSTLCAFL